MGFSVAFALIALLSLSSFAQKKKGAILEFQEYESKLDLDCEGLVELKAPLIKATCKGELDVRHEDALFSGGCAGTIERTWIATDDCGGEARAIQYIRLLDETPPVFHDVPDELVLSRSEIQDIPEPLVSDDCDGQVTIRTEEELLDGEERSTLMRTWIAVDACGNQSRAKTLLRFTED